jgi:hypothetical protein
MINHGIDLAGVEICAVIITSPAEVRSYPVGWAVQNELAA